MSQGSLPAPRSIEPSKPRPPRGKWLIDRLINAEKHPAAIRDYTGGWRLSIVAVALALVAAAIVLIRIFG